jgi:hypothetical protein
MPELLPVDRMYSLEQGNLRLNPWQGDNCWLTNYRTLSNNRSRESTLPYRTSKQNPRKARRQQKKELGRQKRQRRRIALSPVSTRPVLRALSLPLFLLS